MDMPAATSSSGLRFSLHAVLGTHSVVAVLSEFVAEAPLIAGLIGTFLGLTALQLGVLAAFTRGMEDEAEFEPLTPTA
jgi:hypothetical protein